MEWWQHQGGNCPMVLEVTKGPTRVYIDPNRCIANAKCTTAAPGIYVLDEETGVATIENADEATMEQLFAGARACPTQAIIIEQLGRRIFPTILTPMFGESGSTEEDGNV
jgi:ferredoxin